MLATKNDLNKEISRLDLKISETKVDLIKWTFSFWITIVLLIVELYLKK